MQENKENKSFGLDWSLIVFAVILVGFVFVSDYFSFEQSTVRELNLKETFYCVHWSQPFEPTLSEWKSRNQVWSYSFNDPESGVVLMQECLVLDSGYRIKKEVKDMNEND